MADAIRYIWYSWFIPSDLNDNVKTAFSEYSPYGHFGTGVMANMYDISEQHLYNDVGNMANTPSRYLTVAFYSSSWDKYVLDLVSPDDDTKNKMNILKLNSSTLTSLLPWNKTDYVKKDRTSGNIVSQSYIPLNVPQFKNNAMTVVKLIIIGYVINCMLKKYGYKYHF